MEETTADSNNKAYFSLSGSALKILAIITMLIDHIGAFIVYPYMGKVSINNYDALYNLYYIMRIMGRVAFPIFIFLMVEGIKHTRDIRKYILRMFIFAIVSEIPFVLADGKSISGITATNVFFTLTIGLVICAVIDKLLETKKPAYVAVCAVLIFAGAFLSNILNTDYGQYGVFAIIAGYIISKLTGNLKKRYSYIATIVAINLVLSCIGGLEIFCLCSILPVCIYNGERGISLKYIFYVFYPAHLLILALIRHFAL